MGLGCAAGAILLRDVLDLAAPDMDPYPLVFPAVLLATLASGVGGGLVALVLGLGASDYFFRPPRFSFEPRTLTHGLNLAVTISALLFVLWLTARYRSSVLARARERLEAEEHLRLVMREVDHRANNLLAIVQSIVNLTKAEGGEARALKGDILGRVGALARAHQLLSSTRWRGAHLEALVDEELRPYALGDGDTGRVRAQGPNMPLSPAEAEAMAMALHELATNAAKYGAFSVPGGRVEVTWGCDGAGVRRVRWQEDGGPRVREPDRQGLGTRLLERVLAASGGRTQMVWRPEGLVCAFELPVSAGRQADRPSRARPAGQGRCNKSRFLAGFRRAQQDRPP